MNSISSSRLCVKILHCGNRNITVPADSRNKYVFYMPMGLFSLASFLDKNGFDVEILHLDLEADSTIEDLMNIESLDAVGLDLHWVNQAPAVMDTLAAIKKKKPSVFTFLGGYTAGFFAGEILETYPPVDAVIRGDGEIPILQLCRLLGARKQKPIKEDGYVPGISLENVQNLVWRNRSGDIVENELSYTASAEDMNRFDFADFSLLRNWKIYRNISKFWTRFPSINKHPLFLMEVGRGCGYNCSICGGNANAQVCLSNRKKKAVRSVDSVMDSIKKAIPYGYSMFFTCFEFENSEEWYGRLFQRIRLEKLRVNFAYESWGLLSKSLLDDLSNSFGEVIVTISPDSADPELRRKNKDPRLFYDNDELEDRMEHISTLNNVKVQLYFGYFLPFETHETIFGTMDYIIRLLVKYSHFTEIMFMNNNTDPCSSQFLNPGKYDTHLTVSSLKDYLRKIKENFKMEKGIPAPQTLLHKPAGMTDTGAVDIANKVTLFSGLLYFRRSLSRLDKLVKRTGIISRYLRETDLSNAAAADFQAGALKKILTGICMKHLPAPAHEDMLQTIENEYREVSREAGIKSPTYYTAGSRCEVLTEDEKNKISLNIRKSRKDVQADFDI